MAVVVTVIVVRFVGMVVGCCGSTDLLLEAGEGDPVDADVAVHPDITINRLPVALHDEVRDPTVRTEVAPIGDGDPGISLGELLTLPPNALLQNARKEEVGKTAILFAPSLFSRSSPSGTFGGVMLT